MSQIRLSGISLSENDYLTPASRKMAAKALTGWRRR